MGGVIKTTYWKPYSFRAAFVRKFIPDVKRNLKMKNGLIMQASIKKHLMFFHGNAFEREENTATLLASYVPADGVIYDLGANIGLYSLAFAANRRNRVIAFEPFDAALKYLKRNISQNNLDNIEVHQIVLSDRKGTCRFTFDNVTTSTSHISSDEEQGAELPCSDLDTYVEEHKLPPPDLIKMDIEGADEPIFKGMENLLKTARPLVYLEGGISNERGEVIAINFLKERGFKIYDLSRKHELLPDTQEYAFIACPDRVTTCN
jgi:FkbM family methyltransferase